jgi:hypothetical protein
MAPTQTHQGVDPAEEQKAKSAVSHLVADLIKEYEPEHLSGDDIATEIECSFEASETIPDTLTNGFNGTATEFLYEELFSEIEVTTESGTTQPLDETVVNGNSVCDVSLTGGRPAGLEPHGKLAVDDETAEKATADFTIIDEIGRDRADVLAENDLYTWGDITSIGQSEVADLPSFGEAIARSLMAEANSHADLSTTLAREAYERADAIETEEDGRGISYPLEQVEKPPGKKLNETEHGQYYGWYYLEDIDHPLVPDAPDVLKTRELPNGKEDIEQVCQLLGKDKNPILIGPPGVGKNTILRKAFAETNRPLLVIPCDSDMLTQELLGIHTVESDGSVVFENGPLPTIVKNGGGICFDEINAAPHGVQKALHKLLEDDPMLYVKGKGEVIEPHPEFYALATMNPSGPGTEALHDAMIRRFAPINIGQLPAKKEIELLDTKVNSGREIIAKEKLEGLVKVGRRARQQSEEGWMPYITTDHLETICHMYDGGGNLKGSIEMVIGGSQQMSISRGGTGGLDEDALKDLIGDI